MRPLDRGSERRLIRALALTLAASAALSACAPLLVGGAVVGGVMLATDRRTSGTIIEDETIEVKATGRVREALGERGGVNVTSFNRVVLISGDVASEADKATVEQIVSRVENVKSVVNELVVGFSRTLAGRSRDAFLTTKVKASLIDAKDLFANSIKVITAHETVYLMGRVTEREATRAAEIARGVDGVRKVVRVFEVVSEGEIARTQPHPAPVTSSASAPAR